jgi:hypothetical protein
MCCSYEPERAEAATGPLDQVFSAPSPELQLCVPMFTWGEEGVEHMASPLVTNEQAFSGEEKAQLVQLREEMEIIKDQMSKVAVVLDQLVQAVIAQREQRPKPEAQLSEITPLLQAMKVHVDSFPHALREVRRSDAATQKAVEGLSVRLREVESRLGIPCTASEPAP